MEKSWRKELLEIVAASEPITRKLRAIDRAQWPVRFSHVTQPAQAFLVATIAPRIHEAIWILCPNVHSQELIFESLLNWHPTALFLPEAEFAAVENVLPDPEIAAERLALLMHASLKSLRAGNSPSVVALSIYIRGRRHYRCAWNFLATNSIRCANSTSILKPRYAN